MSGLAFSAEPAPPGKGDAVGYVRDASVWRTPPIRREGFQFEVQISSMGTAYDPERVRASIRAHDLGEYESAVSKVIAAEWGYSFTHLDGHQDGAGRRIKAGYPNPPADREECLRVIDAFLHRQYLMGAPHPWASMNGHFPWHHYAAEFGFDQIGSEIGENINNYQWHIALTRGAARQYSRPWFIDFSAWHGPSVTDYSEEKVWGENSGPDHGHSMSLFERSLFMSYPAGAGQITVEAGGTIAFRTARDDRGHYLLSPFGEVCQRFRRFSLAHPDVGIPLTPIAVVLDYHHGAYPGFGNRRAFWHFDYNAGDAMTWDLIDLIWPGGWEVMGRNETGTMVAGPCGDTFDVLLQNVPSKVLNSYPCAILSGDLHLSVAEAARFVDYVQRGGTLIVNSAYLKSFPEFGKMPAGAVRHAKQLGAGMVIAYGPDFQVTQLAPILREHFTNWLPVVVQSAVQYLVNERDHSLLVTLINNDGVTKAPKEKPVVDPAKRRAVTIHYQGARTIRSVRDIKNNQGCFLRDGSDVRVVLPPGQIAVLEFTFE